MITIDQLLESVDLDFEPRYVTKDSNGVVHIWNTTKLRKDMSNGHYPPRWIHEGGALAATFTHLKLAEFDGKDWTECIYEVPRKEELKNKIKIGTLYIDKGVTFGDGDDDDVGFVEDYQVPQKTTGKIQKLECYELADEEFNPTGKFEPMCFMTLIQTINSLVDAVNKHSDIIQQIGDWGTRKGECLWCEKLTSVNLGE